MCKTRRVLKGIAWSLALICCSAAGQQATLDEIVVIGEQPGPGLWRVTNGDHTLWILGVYSPLPKKMIWKASRVEAVIAESQEIIGPSGANYKFDSGFFEKVKAGPAISRSMKNTEGELKDLVSPDLFARWLSLKEKYLGRSNRWNKLRPTFAAIKLEKEAIDAAGLVKQSTAINRVVERSAKQHAVKINGASVVITVSVKHLHRLFDNIAKLKLHDIDCFRSTVDGLESKLAAMKAGANAWATGDIGRLKQLNQAPKAESCGEMLVAAMMLAGNNDGEQPAQYFMTEMKKAYERAVAASRTRWLSLAESALKNNSITFGMLSMHDIVDADGLLAQLKAKGYEVVEPQ